MMLSNVVALMVSFVIQAIALHRKATDPRCYTGILKGNICCPSQCGSCGGPHCSSRPGGASNCCESVIMNEAGSCESTMPPCVALAPISMAPSQLSTGHYSLGDRTFETSVPSGDGPFQVLILFHGKGHAGADMIDYMHYWQKSFILLGPNGDKSDWNVFSDSSGKDDLGFISNLVDYAATFSNVNPTFTLVGYSKGAFLTHRILIENDDARIVAAIVSNSQLSGIMSRNGSFRVGQIQEHDTVTKPILKSRRLLQITTATDSVVPSNGGDSNTDVPVNFFSWEESAYCYARGYGYSGASHPTVEGYNFSSVTYLGGLVKAYNMNTGNHDFQGTQPIAIQFLNERLANV